MSNWYFRKTAILNNEQLMNQYLTPSGGGTNLQGSPSTVALPSSTPINVIDLIRKSIARAAGDLAANGIKIIRIQPLPGNSVGLNKVQEPHVFYIDADKISRLMIDKAQNKLLANPQNVSQNPQLAQRLHQLVSEMIEHEDLATIEHETAHEQDIIQQLRRAKETNSPPQLNLTEGPAEAAEHKADAYFPAEVNQK